MSESEVVIFGLAILSAFTLLIVIFWVGHWIRSQPSSFSPYIDQPLRRCSSLSYFTKEQILRYLFFLREYDNRIFDLEKAAFCRVTGRIFPNCVTWYDRIKLDWSFLQKRHPGHWVSWGSLTDEQQRAILDAHHKLEGYQFDFSCPVPSPSNITPEYAVTVPGPLYVDLETKVLMGWKVVPETDFEVLIVTKPRGIFETPKR